MAVVCRAVVLMAILPLLSAVSSTPRFKWGQNKESIFLSVIVRDLDKDTVTASLPSPGEFKFRGKTTKGEEYSLDLELREDIVVEEPVKWKINERSDKFGTAVFCTLAKVHQHRWDVLVTDMKKYKKLVDKDWTREDQTLEPEEEIAYVEDNEEWLTVMTGKNKKKIIDKFDTVLVNVRFPWCSKCSQQDESFAQAAKDAKKLAKKHPKWKKVAFAVVDAREERKLAREMGAKCDSSCEYDLFADPKEEPTKFKGQHLEMELFENLEKYLGPAVQVLKDISEVEPIKANQTTCLGKFASDKSPEYAIFKKVAGLMRGELVFTALLGEATASKELELWPHKQNITHKYEGTLADNGTALQDWVKPRSLPLLQEYNYELRNTYEKLGLPLAKVWIDDRDDNPSLAKVVRHAVKRVAKKFIGKIAFVEVKRSLYSYELRDFGLNQPEVYPAFGIASNSSYNAIKYGYEVTDKVAPSAEAFWKDADKAIPMLMAFCNTVLAGKWPEAHESGPVQTNWTKGTVKRISWKSYTDILRPEKPLLLEVYSKYRTNPEKGDKEVEHLASAFDPMSAEMTVASYDTASNYLPPADFTRDKYNSDTEWYFVAGNGAPVQKLMKPKKNAPIPTVIAWASKLAFPKLNAEDSTADSVAQAVTTEFEKLMVDDPPPRPAPPPISMDGSGPGHTLGNSLGKGEDGLGGLGSDLGFGDMGGDMPDMGDMPGMGFHSAGVDRPEL